MHTGKTIINLLLLLLPAMTQAGSLTLSQLMAQFSQIDQRRSEYTETQYLAMLEIPLESQGTLLFQTPDILEKTVANDGGSYRVEGEQLQIEQSGKQHRIALDSYPALAAFVASFRATLAGDQRTLQRYYQITLQGNMDNWSLLLKPKQSDMAAMINTITLSGSGNRIRQIETVEQSGDSSRMQLREQNEK